MGFFNNNKEISLATKTKPLNNKHDGTIKNIKDSRIRKIYVSKLQSHFGSVQEADIKKELKS